MRLQQFVCQISMTGSHVAVTIKLVPAQPAAPHAPARCHPFLRTSVRAPPPPAWRRGSVPNQQVFWLDPQPHRPCSRASRRHPSHRGNPLSWRHRQPLRLPLKPPSLCPSRMTARLPMWLGRRICTKRRPCRWFGRPLLRNKSMRLASLPPPQLPRQPSRRRPCT